MYYVYVLQDKNSQTIYIGFTTNLRNRIAYHRDGPGERFTARQGTDWQLVYYEAYKSETDARVRERKLKQYGQSVQHLKNRLRSSLTSEISAG